MDALDNKSKTLSIISIIVLVIVLGVAYFYFSKNKTNESLPLSEESVLGEENVGDIFADIKTNPFDRPAANPFASPEGSGENPFSDVKLNPFE